LPPPPPLARSVPALYKLVHKAAFIHLLMRPVRQVACPMTTVSALIDEHGIK
jgi:hypothetical protein